MKKTAIGCAFAAIIVVCVALGYWFLASENCVLCSVGKCANLQLINLATGDIGEIQVYDVGRFVEDGKIMDTTEFRTNQTTGTFNFVNCAGLTGYRTTGTYNTCEIELPEKTQTIRRKYYCPACYEQLTSVSNKGYLILDTYDPDDKKVYSTKEEDYHLIRVFDASVSMDEGRMHLEVVGTLKIEEGENGYGRIMIK